MRYKEIKIEITKKNAHKTHRIYDAYHTHFLQSDYVEVNKEVFKNEVSQ
jgi:hypothetical protein